MPNTFTTEVNVVAMIEPNQGHPMGGYRGDADTPLCHLHKCNFHTPSLKVTKHIIQRSTQTFLMASSQHGEQKFSKQISRNAAREASKMQEIHSDSTSSSGENPRTKRHNKLFCLAAAKNHTLAYRKETLYHSLNIGSALIVNCIISISHAAGVKRFEQQTYR